MDQESESATAEDSQEEPQGQGQEPAADVEESKGDEKDKKEPQTFDAGYVRQLRRQAADARTRATKAEEKLQQIEDRDKTESERLNEKATAAESRAQEAEARLLRFEVAAEKELDLRAAAFLTGTTREEIEARADELVELLADKSKSQTPSLDGGARQTAAKRGSPEEEHNDLLLRALGRKS